MKKHLSPNTSGENSALLVIDIQNDYFDDGSHALYNARGALANAEDILARFRSNGLPVIHIQHNNGQGASFFAQDSWGMEIHENVTPLKNEPLIVKRHVSSFLDTDLEDILRESNIVQLVIVGMQTNVCVQGTTKDAHTLGFEVILLEDACAALSLEVHDKTIASLRELATVMKTNAYAVSR